MSLESKKYWVGINMNPAVTVNKFHLLLNYFPSAEAIWNASKEDLGEIKGLDEEVGERFCRERDEGGVEAELDKCRRLGLDLITLEDPDYPDSLRAIEKPPPVLYVKGDFKESDQLGVAMVGTRKNTNYGKTIAEKLARQLVREGLTVVSGMANGIDSVSHKSALAADGRTVAVMGTGFGHTYPKNNANLMRRIVKSGAVISEFPFDQGPERWTFPKRNRIISGLTRGTIVVEAPEGSGALITAHDALSQGREVFAVPGDVRRATMKGTHGLIKDGAKLVEDAYDVVEEFKDLQPSLPFEEAADERPVEEELNDLQQAVYSELDYEPVHFNDIVAETNFSPARVSHIMFQLEMEDLVERLEGNKWVKSE